MFRRALLPIAFLVLMPWTARAAAVEIWLSPVHNSGSSPFTYSLQLSVEEGVRVTALDFLLVGFTSMQLDPSNLGISAPDSVFVPGVLGDGRASVVINSPLGSAIAAGPTSLLSIATFSTPTVSLCDLPYLPGCSTTHELHDHPDYFGGTVYGEFGEVITDYELHLYGVRHVPDAPVPEPAPSLLLVGSLVVGVIRALGVRRG